MSFESLESRCLMSVAASASAGTLFVYGDDGGNDDIKLTTTFDSPSQIVVSARTPAGYYQPVYKVADNKVDKVIIYGRDGNDKIFVDYSVGANVTINGGHGADYIITGGDNCVAFGDFDPAKNSESDDNAADTLIDGAKYNSSLWGQGGNDKLYTGTLNITGPLYGAVSLYGGLGNDTFYTGNASADVTRKVKVYGSLGDDVLHTTTRRELEFYGSSGKDTVDFSDSAEAAWIHIDQLNYNYCGSRLNYNARHVNVHSDVENITGTKYSDDIVDDSLGCVVKGGDGNDYIWTGEGNDKIYGGNGNDTLLGAGGNDSIYGEAGNDLIVGGNGMDLLDGGSGADRFLAKDNYKDVIWGGADSDVLLSSDSIDFKSSVP